MLDRRGFLKGSALAVAAGLALALPTAPIQAAPAQEPAKPAPSERKPEAPKEGTPKDGAPKEAPKKGVLLDKQGREYRVCDMCGANMYVEDKRWTCEQCGFSYDV
jgi:anaerobic selenocysteine-containing dehydrogenase